MLVSRKQLHALEMRVDGLSYDEIGVELCISRTEAYQLICHTLDNLDRFGQFQGGNTYPNLRSWLIENRMTQKELANDTGIAPGTISRILSGRCNPHKKTMQTIADYIGMPVDVAFTKAEEG